MADRLWRRVFHDALERPLPPVRKAAGAHICPGLAERGCDKKLQYTASLGCHPMVSLWVTLRGGWCGCVELVGVCVGVVWCVSIVELIVFVDDRVVRNSKVSSGESGRRGTSAS